MAFVKFVLNGWENEIVYDMDVSISTRHIDDIDDIDPSLVHVCITFAGV